jgi:hypothetical protein
MAVICRLHPAQPGRPEPVRIGRERLRQLLHARGISFQRTRTWKESADPGKDAELDQIEHVNSACPDHCFASGQFGPLSIRPCHGPCWAHRKRPVRLRATCHRSHGIRYFHGCYSLGDDQHTMVVSSTTGVRRSCSSVFCAGSRREATLRARHRELIPGALIALRSSRLAASPASRPTAARGPAAWHGSICVAARSGSLPGAL